jgi:hypothetical protein
MDKADVLSRAETARAAFNRLLVEVGDTRMEQPGVENDWSVKDILAHIMVYDRWTAAQLNAARESREATDEESYGSEPFPPDVDMNDLDARNAAIRTRYHPTPLAEVIAGAEHAFAQLMDAIQALNQQQLDDPAFLGWNEALTTTQAIGIQTWEHYADHEPAFRQLIMQNEGM